MAAVSRYGSRPTCSALRLRAIMFQKAIAPVTAALGRELARIVYQVPDYLLQPRRIAGDHSNAWVEPGREAQFLGVDRRSQSLDGSFDGRGEVEQLDVETQLP